MCVFEADNSPYAGHGDHCDSLHNDNNIPEQRQQFEENPGLFNLPANICVDITSVGEAKARAEEYHCRYE